jgi:glycerol-3-phosphate dehydrogenase
MNRAEMLRRAGARTAPWDIVIVGGGATGVGIAIDAASRNYDVLLLERSDFGKGTSSRSTKLVHGGVRYLQQGNLPLVFEALHEREVLARNAPHLVQNLPFVVPAYDWWEKPYYGLGLKVYDALARESTFGPTEILSRNETLARLPNLRTAGLRGGVLYHDGQFDDARLLITMTSTAADQGATLLNYAEVTGFIRERDSAIGGVTVRDLESGSDFEARAKVVINATGPFSDSLRRLADAAVTEMVTPSQGIHLVVSESFLGGKSAIMVPRTTDGRVMFAIPWHAHTVLGTTDTPIDSTSEEPTAQNREVEFVLQNAARYLQQPPGKRDVLSVFAGIRPLIRSNSSGATAAISRDHQIHTDASGLITITGGKWTTYRRMAELCVDQAAKTANLPARPCVTRNLQLHGAVANGPTDDPLHQYGSDASAVLKLAENDPRLAQRLHPAAPHIGAEVAWAVRMEMARTVEDVLARRFRVLFVDAQTAIEMAPKVAELMAGELGAAANWISAELDRFRRLASRYLLDFAADASESSLTR